MCECACVCPSNIHIICLFSFIQRCLGLWLSLSLSLWYTIPMYVLPCLLPLHFQFVCVCVCPQWEKWFFHRLYYIVWAWKSPSTFYKVLRAEGGEQRREQSSRFSPCRIKISPVLHAHCANFVLVVAFDFIVVVVVVVGAVFATPSLLAPPTYPLRPNPSFLSSLWSESSVRLGSLLFTR